MKSVNVGILNTTSTTTTTGMATSPGQTAVTAGGLTKDKLPCMLKLLTGACVVQGICLIATAATLGCYVNENVSLLGNCLWSFIPEPVLCHCL